MQQKSSAGGAGVSDRSPIQTFFLARLQHLMDQQGRYSNLVGPEDWRTKLIARALYSSYRDLSDLGLAEEARQILERGRTPHSN
jgi:hypothetical protein